MTATELARNELIDACVADCQARVGGTILLAIKFLERKRDRIKCDLSQEQIAAMVERADHQPEIVTGIDLAKLIVTQLLLISEAVDRRIGHTGLGEPNECPFDREQLEFDVKQQVLAWFSRV